MNSPLALLAHRRRLRREASLRRLAWTPVLLAWLGCWQEVSYEPRPQVADAAASDSGSAAGEPTPPPNADPTASELFGEEPVPPPIETAPVATSPIDTAPDETEPTSMPPDAAVVDVTPTGPEREVTPAMRRDAWTAASQWSLAAAVYATGLPPERYESYLDEATRAAVALGIELPSLPIPEGTATLNATVAAALTGDLGANLANSISQNVDAAAGESARIALGAHALLLTYRPLGGEIPEAAAAIRAAGERSRLPAELWQPLVEQLNRRAEYPAIKKAVFKLRQAVSDHLAK